VKKLTIGKAKHLLDCYNIDLLDCSQGGGLSIVLGDTQKRLQVIHECEESTNQGFTTFVNSMDTGSLVANLQKFDVLLRDFYPENVPDEYEEQDEEFKAFDDALAEQEHSIFCWEKLYELVGMSGQPWSCVLDMSLRELQSITTGHDRQLWNIASHILATIVNVNADKQNQVSAADINPYVKPRPISMEALGGFICEKGAK